LHCPGKLPEKVSTEVAPVIAGRLRFGSGDSQEIASMALWCEDKPGQVGGEVADNSMSTADGVTTGRLDGHGGDLQFDRASDGLGDTCQAGAGFDRKVGVQEV